MSTSSDTTEGLREQAAAAVSDHDAAKPTDPAAEAAEHSGAAEDGSSERQEQRPERREARYRRELREAEAERDRLAEQVESLQRQRVADTLTNVFVSGHPQLHDPADLWASGVQLADLVAEDGTVVTERVTAAAADLIHRKPHLGRFWGTGGDAGQGQEPFGVGASWRDALQGLA